MNFDFEKWIRCSIVFVHVLLLPSSLPAVVEYGHSPLSLEQSSMR